MIRIPARLLCPLAVALGLLGSGLVSPAGAQRVTPDSGPARAAEPLRPVILVPGWLDTAEDLDPLAEQFIDAGWPTEYVRRTEFPDPVGSNVRHAELLGRVLERVSAELGAPRVDIVAHSMGGLAVRYYLTELGGSARVGRVVFLGTPHGGTWAAHLAWGDGGEEMEPGSAFLERLNRRPPVPPSVEATAIWTPTDLRIVPIASAAPDGMRNVRVCCPGHTGLLSDPETFGWIETFLRGSPEDGAGNPGAISAEPEPGPSQDPG